MPHIAILGATSQIARDLILGWAEASFARLDLFARQPEAVSAWAVQNGLSGPLRIATFEDFGANDTRYDAVLNFVGVGDPARAAKIGSSILDITLRYDDMALAYQDRFPECRYIFLSSGAIYGSTFLDPADRSTRSWITVNDPAPQEFYGVAKLHAEIRHRARADRPIVDVRVFNIFSRTQDLSARFFITDIVRAIRDGTVLKVSGDAMVRDFLHPSDFRRLIEAVLTAAPTNAAVDCYSRAPVDKPTLLKAMQNWFGLRWEIDDALNIVNTTGTKPFYHSVNHRAAEFGYDPIYSSLESLRTEITALLGSKLSNK